MASLSSLLVLALLACFLLMISKRQRTFQLIASNLRFNLESISIDTKPLKAFFKYSHKQHKQQSLTGEVFAEAIASLSQVVTRTDPPRLALSRRPCFNEGRGCYYELVGKMMGLALPDAQSFFLAETG